MLLCAGHQRSEHPGLGSGVGSAGGGRGQPATRRQGQALSGLQVSRALLGGVGCSQNPAGRLLR